MRGTMLKRIIALLPAVLLAAVPGLSRQQNAQQQNSGQSQTGDALADAARKAREQQKEAPKPKKVFTNDDIAPARPAAASAQAQPQTGDKAAVQPQAAQSSKDGAAGSQDAGAPKEDPNGEAAWRKRFGDQRAKIAKAQAELDVLQRELQRSQVQYYPDPQKAMEQQFSRKDIDDKQAKIDAKKQEIAQLNQQLSDMEDELKKAGGDPGWARQ